MNNKLHCPIFTNLKINNTLHIAIALDLCECLRIFITNSIIQFKDTKIYRGNVKSA